MGGDAEAFARLVRPYQDKLYGYLRYRQPVDADAEDLLQEVLLKAWRGLLAGHAPQRFGAWLFTIARRVVIDLGRKQRARPRLVAVDPPREASDIETPETELQALQTRTRLEAAVAELPDKQREVFILRLTTELTFRELAELRSEPLSTVLGHMSYAVAKLKQRLS